jgi:hypothetical protein
MRHRTGKTGGSFNLSNLFYNRCPLIDEINDLSIDIVDLFPVCRKLLLDGRLFAKR